MSRNRQPIALLTTWKSVVAICVCWVVPVSLVPAQTGGEDGWAEATSSEWESSRRPELAQARDQEIRTFRLIDPAEQAALDRPHSTNRSSKPSTTQAGSSGFGELIANEDMPQVAVQGQPQVAPLPRYLNTIEYQQPEVTEPNLAPSPPMAQPYPQADQPIIIEPSPNNTGNPADPVSPHNSAGGCGSGGCGSGGCVASFGSCGLLGCGNIWNREACSCTRDLDQVFPLRPLSERSRLGLYAGGWMQAGYHSDSTGLLNDRPDDLNWHQAWFTLENRQRTLDGYFYSLRSDLVYGIDGDNLQAFGNNPGNFDFQNGFDHGAYAWSIPQLYGEGGNEQWRIKGGHFLADFNYESFRSPTNFFYSRSYASVLAAPITLNGILFTTDWGPTQYTVGYTEGWNTAFDDFDNGAAFFGQYSRRLGETSGIAYTVSAGDFGRLGDGYAHSIIYERQIGCQWNYAFDTTYFNADGDDNQNFESVGLVQYLTYAWTCNIDAGQRLEWWRSNFNGAEMESTYAYTVGLNYRVGSRVNIRPELRYNWGEQFNDAAVDTAIFGIDTILRF